MSLTVTHIMSDDHRHCDQLFIPVNDAVSSKRWTLAEQLIHTVITEIHYHFQLEESSLFPEYESASGEVFGPTEVMRREHTNIRGLLELLKQAITTRDSSLYFGQFESISIYLQQHNMKEENILYPLIDSHYQKMNISISSALDKLRNRFV